MRRSILEVCEAITALALAAAVVPATAHAEFTTDDFHVRSAQDLVDVCSVAPDDKLYTAAVHFCEGFVVGAWQFHQAQANGPEGRRLVCPPDPPPTRDQAVAMFVAWSGTHPDRMAEPGVEALFRFFIEKYPCPAAAPAKKGASK